MPIYALLKAKKFKVPTFTGWKLQGRKRFHGMKISIENRKGSIRKGTDSDGNKWETKMLVPYGYIRGSFAVDKDHVDCFLGSNKDSEKVFVIHQIVPETGKFDEDKVMLGFNSSKKAKKMYLKHYDKPDYFGKMDEFSIVDFKKKIFGSRKGKKII